MKVIYNSLFKRTSTYAVAIMASAFFFERAIDVTSNLIFDSINKGVSVFCCLCNKFVQMKCYFSCCRNNGRTSRASTNRRAVDCG